MLAAHDLTGKHWITWRGLDKYFKDLETSLVYLEHQSRIREICHVLLQKLIRRHVKLHVNADGNLTFHRWVKDFIEAQAYGFIAANEFDI